MQQTKKLFKTDRNDDGAIIFVGASGGGESKLKTATIKVKIRIDVILQPNLLRSYCK